MLVKFERDLRGGAFSEIRINPDQVASIQHQVEWVGEVKKHFHLSGFTVINMTLLRADGDPFFEVVLGTLDEVAAKLNVEAQCKS